MTSITPTATFEIIDNVAKITFNRPDKYNSVTQDLALTVQKYLARAASNPEVRAVYITGNGKAFCAGQDLKEATEDNGLDLERLVGEHFNPIAKAITSMEKPVVAAVNGVAAGAGANIALLCDIVVAKESASFIQAFSKIGLVPDTGGSYILPRLIGYQRALAITMFGDKISAAEAEKMGMIYKCFPDEEFEESAWKLALKLAKMPTLGLALTKKAYQESMSNTLDQQLAVEEKYQIQASNSADYKEGTTAFLEKRKPTFIGK